jgi:hypothetical protein
MLSRRRVWFPLGVAALVVVGAAVALAHVARPPLLHMTATDRPLPADVGEIVARDGQPPFSVPAAARLDAVAPLANGQVFAYGVYVIFGHRCEVTYAASPGSLLPVPGDGSGVSAHCLPVTSQLPPSLSLAVAQVAGPLVLYGQAPRRANRLKIVTDAGHVHEYRVPYVPIRSTPSKEAIILDLSSLGPESVKHAILLHGSHVLELSSFSP